VSTKRRGRLAERRYYCKKRDAFSETDQVATYAIGDVQGCYDALMRLLEVIDFDPSADRLWFAGDLVNRGPQSAATLRFVRGLGERAVSVLGNHDLHLIATALGGAARRKDTLGDVLMAPDRDELLHWLRQQPLMHQDSQLGFAMLHAGLPPEWTVEQAASLAREAEMILRGAHHPAALLRMYGDEPNRWKIQLSGLARFRFVINCFTRLRYCHQDGRIDLRSKEGPNAADADLVPWFAMPQRKSRETPIVFGHWSTLGRIAWPEHRVYGLDTGCVWGGALTALCLDNGRLSRVHCKAEQAIEGA
jgi:bis(5'-nucleosyl)-tetraphosphatase (symmetrical)